METRANIMCILQFYQQKRRLTVHRTILLASRNVPSLGTVHAHQEA